MQRLVLLCLLLCLPVVVEAQQKLDEQYEKAAAQIIGAAMVDPTAYERLEYLSDQIGPRFSGSPQLDKAIQWTMEQMKMDGLEQVRAEPVRVPHWVRGEEWGEMVSPARHKLPLMALGSSVGTPPEGVTAEVVEVTSYEELDRLGEALKDKIVFYYKPMRADLPPGQAYGEAVEFRVSGASRAAKWGARAIFIRSVTTRSLSTPHTGNLRYDEALPKIPAAALSTEAADLIHRLIARGQRVVVKLRLGAQTLPDAESANVIGELRGRERPEEIVLIGGHIDSWDVGTGASDDGAGCIVAMEAVRLLAKLQLKPRRTIRVVLFTNEENGLKGALEYAEKHKEELPKHIAAIESDSGAARPVGFSFTGGEKGMQALNEILRLLKTLKADSVVKTQNAGADLTPLVRAGVLGLGLRQDSTHYFDIHHTEADTFDKIDRADLAMNVAAMALMAYVLADMPVEVQAVMGK